MTELKDIIKIAKTMDPSLNYDGLLKAYEGIPIKIVVIKDCAGMATFDRIYINPDAIFKYGPSTFFFVLLHELGHFKRVKKDGSDYHLKQLSLNNFDEFAKHLISEEIFADRYGTYLYRLINGKNYDGFTQELHLPKNQIAYIPVMKLIFGKINNNMSNYNKLLESMIKWE